MTAHSRLAAAWSAALGETSPDPLHKAWAGALGVTLPSARASSTVAAPTNDTLAEAWKSALSDPAQVDPPPVAPAAPEPAAWNADFTYNDDGKVAYVRVICDDDSRPQWLITPHRDDEGRAVSARIQPIQESQNG